jgi:uncharacterized protein (DUF1800 family)
MQNPTTNKCLLILLMAALTFNSLHLTAAARDEKPQTGAAPATWVGDLSPITNAEWNYDRAAHLLERAGFGGTPDEIKALAAMTPQEAVRQMVYFQNMKEAQLQPFVETGIFPSKTWSRDRMGAAFQAILFGTLDKLPPEQRRVMMADERTGVTAEDKRTALTDKQAVVDKFYYWRNVDLLETARLQTWLADRMLKTNRPLQEKLVLFWHGHFATSNDKIRDYRKMMGQFAMLREHANGNLRDLLIGIGKDPAMLIYLDNRQNYKGHPNENFAREIMELFALGVGNYTEADIKEAARAFTGWSLDNNGMGFLNRANLHDEGEKTVLGRAGKFKGEDVVDILLAQPACARFITRKLYRFFVREELSKELEEKLAASLRANKYAIAPFLEQMFLSRDFYSPASFATQIKSPVQLVVSTYKKLGLKDAPTFPKFSAITAGLGQEIFYPPNVKGWDGGRAWVNPATVFQRQNVARYILFPEEVPVVKDAHLAGSRRLSGDFIHNQFLEMADRGDYKSFPNGGGAMMAANSPGGAMAETSKLSGEDFNLFRGVFNAAVRAIAAVPAEPRRTADFSLSKLLQSEGVMDAAGAVDNLMRRFLRTPLTGERRQTLIRFLEQQLGGSQLDYSRYRLEKDLRELLHLIMSAPEYQLS